LLDFFISILSVVARTASKCVDDDAYQTPRVLMLPGLSDIVMAL
jgi:hypothetical protein